MEPRELRSWLLCQPRPAAVGIVTGDQQQHKLEIGPGMQWIEVAKSVCALGPVRVEALDAKGNLIRVIGADELEPEEEEEETIEAGAGDLESQRFIVVAKLLADAYKHSTEVAFDKLAGLFDAVNRRSESLEKTVASLLRFREQQVLEAAAGADGEGGSFEQQLVAAMMQGKMQSELERAAVTAATKAVTNGVAKHPPAGENGTK
jgi:hypothetical protein